MRFIEETRTIFPTAQRNLEHLHLKLMQHRS